MVARGATGPSRPAARAAAARVQLLGPLTVTRGGVVVALPPSRKVRALLAYLALAPAPVSRSRLCELLWEAPVDPRGELRWCLSKIRRVLAGGIARVLTRGDTVRLDLAADCVVDALEVVRAIESGAGSATPAQRRALGELCHGDLLEGLEIDRSPLFDAWLAAQRRRLRGCQAALLERLVADAPADEALAYLERWLALAPLDRRAHERLLAALAASGRAREGEEHLRAASRLFEAEGLDAAPLGEAWREARAPYRGVDRVVEARAAAAAPAAGRSRRASIAVMPFADGPGSDTAGGRTGRALAHDVINRLARLRNLFVIAQGSVFALHERGIGAEEGGRMLDVDYVAGGSIRLDGRSLTVFVELAEARSARVIWSESFEQDLGATLLVPEAIGDRIVASIASAVEAAECKRAILRPPGSLDAWEAQHRGLWHMYRFTRRDNERARGFFETAVRLDPTFSRAWAGLSFTHFQSAFQAWAPRELETERALQTAGRGLMSDDRDPAAHWAMGRALWLLGRREPAISEVERSIDLSPNFALGHYTLAFIHSQEGDPSVAISAADQARSLSPFDPLLFGMFGARAFALARLGRAEEAAAWAVKAAARPNAHHHIVAIAAFCLAATGALEEARTYAAAIRRTAPRYRIDDFLAAFRLDPDGAARFSASAARLGMG